MKTKNNSFKNTILAVLLFSIAITGAIVHEAHTPFLKTLAYTWLVVEGVALVLTQFGAKTSIFAAGMVLGADVYADTVLLKAQAMIKDTNVKKFQSRPILTNAIGVFMKDREYTIPNLAKIRRAETQATEALYMKRKDFTIITAKSCSPTGETSGSGKVDVTFVQRGFRISSNHKQYQGNQVGAADALANDLWNGENSLWAAVDQYLLDYLETNKSGTNLGGSAVVSGISGGFDTVHDIMPIDDSSELFFYNLVEADMQKNNYGPRYNDIADTMWNAKRLQYINQGAGNSTNSSFQFANFDFFPSNLLSPGLIGGTTYTSIHYIIPDGGVAILDWNDPMNVAGEESGERKAYTMQSMVHPEFTFDVFRYKTCADTSASGGGVQDFTTVWEFIFNFAVAKQPISVSGETPIFKYGVTASFVS